MPTCSLEDFNTRKESRPACPDATAVGYSGVEVEFNVIPPDQAGQLFHVPVYNLDPSPGSAATLGFVVLNVPITIDVGVSETQPYNLVASLHNIPQALLLYKSEVTLWGNPASPAHDSLRGNCLGEIAKPSIGPISLGNCPVNIGSTAFLTLPRACAGPLTTFFSGLSWEDEAASGSAGTHDGSVPPSPLGMTGCDKLDFAPTISAQPTTKAAASPTGLDFSLDVEDEGLENPAGIAAADIAKAVVTLPEGFSTNPSVAEGLEVCTEADLARETASCDPGAGCPDASKIGTVEVETPLLDETAQRLPLHRRALREPLRLAARPLHRDQEPEARDRRSSSRLKVEPDPVTGQLTTVAEDMPQLPFSHFRLHFREGTRSPLVTPPACGTYDAEAELIPLVRRRRR